MKAHWSNADVQQYASAALLVIGATDPSNKNVRSILKSGGVRALVGALHVHPEVAAVQENGCWALAQLTTLDGSYETIGGSRGVEAVLKAMRKLRDTPSVQARGCATIANMSRNSSYATLFLSVSLGVS